MSNVEVLNEMLESFQGFDANESQLINNHAYIYKVKVGTTLVESGSICRQVYFVVQGRIRVFKTLPDGKEITLYRVIAGEMCLFSMSCILDHIPLDAMATVEIDAEILVIPESVFLSLLSTNSAFQTFIMRRLLSALSDVLLLLEEVTFHSMNQRVAKLLLEKLEDAVLLNTSPTLKLTHEEISLELGTAREVVSRLLKEFEKQDILLLSRGLIQIKRKKELETIARV